MSNLTSNSLKICIIGAGYSGICAGIKLQQDLNLNAFTIYDENEEIGGTWLTSTYPGCACDVSSHLYSYSFEPNPDWTTSYPKQPEILEYLKRVAAKHKLYRNIKFNHQVKSLTWDEKINKWKVVVCDKISNSQVELIYDIIISGLGGLRVPNIPKEFLSFTGPMMHSAKWDSTIELQDKVVAVIGSGCSAVQIVPELDLTFKVKKLLSFQRHAAWIVPLGQFQIPKFLKIAFRISILQWLYRMFLFFTNEIQFSAFKANTRLSRIASWYGRSYLARQVPNNPELKKKLTPDYPFGCKRVSPSNKYYKSLGKPNAEVITSKITSVQDHKIITDDGNEYDIDVLILATGYQVQNFGFPLEVFGRNSKNIFNEWKKPSGPSHYLGITSYDAPNMFGLLGPNTAYGHNSVIFAIECQMNWIVQVLQEMQRRDSKVVAVKESVEQEYTNNIKERMKDTVWAYGCGSWYANEHGIITALYPSSLISYWNETRKIDCSKLNFE